MQRWPALDRVKVKRRGSRLLWYFPTILGYFVTIEQNSVKNWGPLYYSNILHPAGFIQAFLQFVVFIVFHPEASTEVTHIISAIGEVPSVPAPCDTEMTPVKGSTIQVYFSSTHLLNSSCLREFTRNISSNLTLRSMIMLFSHHNCVFVSVQRSARSVITIR